MTDLSKYFMPYTIEALKKIAAFVPQNKMKQYLSTYRYVGANAPYCILREVYKEKYDAMSMAQLYSYAEKNGVSTLWREGGRKKTRNDLISTLLTHKLSMYFQTYKYMPKNIVSTPSVPIPTSKSKSVTFK